MWGTNDSKTGSPVWPEDNGRERDMGSFTGYTVGAYWGYITSCPQTIRYGIDAGLQLGSTYHKSDYIMYAELNINPYMVFDLAQGLSLTAGMGKIFSLPTFKRMGNMDKELSHWYGDEYQTGLLEKIDYVKWYSTDSYYLSAGMRYSITSHLYVGGQVQYLFLILPAYQSRTRSAIETSITIGYTI